MGRRDHSVRIQLPVFLNFLDSFIVFFCLYVGSDVGVPRAIVDQMADLLTAVAPYFHAQLVILISIVFIVLFLFGLVFRVLAARLVPSLLSTAPPDFATVLATMRPATPVEVLLFNVVLSAVFAHFLLDVKLALLLFQLLNSFLHFLALHHQVLLLFLQLLLGVKVFICLLSFDFDLLLLLLDLFLELVVEVVDLRLEFFLVVEQLLSVLSVVVTVGSGLLHILLQVEVLVHVRLDCFLSHAHFVVEFIF